MKGLSLKKAKIEWREGNAPVATDFDDVYFSTEDGLAESRYVFLEGIGGSAAWENKDSFTIGETGFGTGLNFLMTWQSWRQTAGPKQRLTFVSVEAFPLKKEQLKRAHSCWPELVEFSALLCERYPTLHPGFHQLTFDEGRVCLLLLMGTAEELLAELRMEADAWYLDGFAPSKNASLWNDDLFEQVARCSAKNARLTSFTVAGIVKRGLAAVGFEISKRQGFGKKRECLSAEFGGRRVSTTKPKSVAVIGAGIAGASAAYALQREGLDVTLIEAGSSVASETSGNPVAIFEPRMNRNQDEDGLFHVAAYLHALRVYDDLEGDGASIWVGPRGLEKRPTNSELTKRFSEWVILGLLPEEHMELTKNGGLWFPKAGAVNPRAICEALTKDIAVCANCKVGGLSWEEGQWHLALETSEQFGSFDSVVLAGGIANLDFLKRDDFQVNAKRGQLTFLPHIEKARESHPVSFGSYLAATENFEVVGATYKKLDSWNDGSWRPLSDDDHQQNLAALAAEFPERQIGDVVGGRTAIRATTVDRVPVVGADPDRPNLWLAFGFGSRGFLTAPLAGAALASEIAGSPNPIPMSLWAALSPERFRLRRQRREG